MTGSELKARVQQACTQKAEDVAAEAPAQELCDEELLAVAGGPRIVNGL